MIKIRARLALSFKLPPPLRSWWWQALRPFSFANPRARSLPRDFLKTHQNVRHRLWIWRIILGLAHILFDRLHPRLLKAIKIFPLLVLKVRSVINNFNYLMEKRDISRKFSAWFYFFKERTHSRQNRKRIMNRFIVIIACFSSRARNENLRNVKPFRELHSRKKKRASEKAHTHTTHNYQ